MQSVGGRITHRADGKSGQGGAQSEPCGLRLGGRGALGEAGQQGVGGGAVVGGGQVFFKQGLKGGGRGGGGGRQDEKL
jgi:hypothetical protein